MKKDISLTRHMLGSIDRIEQYTSGVSREDFMNNFLIQDGVIRNVEVIGEASRHLSQDIKEKYPSIPWRKIGAMRNKLIHEYFGIDLEAVWNVAQVEIPELKSSLLGILNSESDE